MTMEIKGGKVASGEEKRYNCCNSVRFPKPDRLPVVEGRS